jgi:hypothetical protein
MSTWGQLGVNLRSTWVNLGSAWGQPGINLGSTWGQPGVNLGQSGSIWGQFGVRLGSTWGQPAAPYHGRPADDEQETEGDVDGVHHQQRVHVYLRLLHCVPTSMASPIILRSGQHLGLDSRWGGGETDRRVGLNRMGKTTPDTIRNSKTTLNPK